MTGESYKILLRLSFSGIAEINPFVRYWLAIMTSPTPYSTKTKKIEEK